MGFFILNRVRITCFTCSSHTSVMLKIRWSCLTKIILSQSQVCPHADPLGPFQASNFSCVKSNVNEQNLLFELICIRFDTWKVRRLKRALVRSIEIIDIECGLLSRVSQKIVATKWWIYKGKISSPQDILCKSNRFFSRKSKMADLKGKLFCQIGLLSRDSAHSISNNSMVRPKGITKCIREKMTLHFYG